MANDASLERTIAFDYSSDLPKPTFAFSLNSVTKILCQVMQRFKRRGNAYKILAVYNEYATIEIITNIAKNARSILVETLFHVYFHSSVMLLLSASIGVPLWLLYSFISMSAIFEVDLKAALLSAPST